MNSKDKANAFKRLLNDDTFNLVLEEVKGEQVKVFPSHDPMVLTPY